MTVASKHQKIDDLMNKASESLARTAYFEAERMAVKALNMAFQDLDVERMARIVMPLLEARRQRLQQALDVGEVTIIDAGVPAYYGELAAELAAAGVPVWQAVSIPPTQVEPALLAAQAPGRKHELSVT